MNFHLHWNPDPVAFYLPFLNHPIAWYGVLFSIGLMAGFYLLRLCFRWFLCFRCDFHSIDILDWNSIEKKQGRQLGLRDLNAWLEKERVKKEVCKPPIRFVTRHLSERELMRYKNRAWIEKRLGAAILTLKQKSKQFAEHLTFYAMVSIIIGARLGHVLCYENLSDYLFHPLRICKVWEGGLASHGALFGLLIGITLFCLRKKKNYPMISFLKIIDFLVIPGLLAGVFIRLGNFINQEVLGTVTSSFLGVVFLHPVGGFPPLLRHPTQLYEACFYLACFCLFFYRFPKWIFQAGKMSGLCLVTTFTFRFLIEFIKERQSFYASNHLLNMGQYLSVPCILIGIFFLVIGRYRPLPCVE